MHGPEPKSAKNEKEVKVGKDFDIDKLKHYSRFFSAMFLSLSLLSLENSKVKGNIERTEGQRNSIEIS